MAFIGWEHEHEHRQLVEIRRELNRRGVEINELNVGKLYRQFLALLQATCEQAQENLAATAAQYGGLIWSIDGIQPEGHGSLLCVLYEVFSGRPVAALQREHLRGRTGGMVAALSSPAIARLATLSDGEASLMAAL